MYNGATRRLSEEDTLHRREYQAQSPTHCHPPYSPKDGPHPLSPYQYSSRPSTSAAMSLPPPMSPGAGQLPSPKLNGTTHHVALPPHNIGASTHYDPLSEHREGNTGRRLSQSYSQSPSQARSSLPPYNSYHPEPTRSPAIYQSSTEARPPFVSPKLPVSHAHPVSRPDTYPESPSRTKTESHIYTPPGGNHTSSINGHGAPPSSQGTVDDDTPHGVPLVKEEAAPAKRADPMSFSNILSNNTAETTPAATLPRSMPVSKVFKNSAVVTNGDSKPLLGATRKTSTKSSTKGSPVIGKSPVRADLDILVPPKTTSHKRKAHVLSEKENERVEREMTRIETTELSDLDVPAYESAKRKYDQSRQLHLQGQEDDEKFKRKRRYTASGNHLSAQLSIQAEAGKQRFRTIYEHQALQEVQQKEIQDEKERKKDMQRKRRREKTLQQQTQLQKDAYDAAINAKDAEEKDKFLREAQKAAKKVITTQKILERADQPEGFREVTPLAPNLEGGVMSAFQTANHVSPEPPKKKVKGAGPSSRPKKSKEKKRAEKDAAAAGYAALQKEELVMIAPKDSEPSQLREGHDTRSQRDYTKESSPASPMVVTNYNSKGYNQIYDQIWKDIARKDVPKVCKIKDTSLSTKQSNLRKTAQLAAKEARRWQLRTNKGTKDVQARAKRSMREMMTFWKRNERTERDLRKNAEKQELENAKKAEADREANRQKRKLNFLIQQTELYSHFVGSKIKTDEVERSTDSADIAGSDQTLQPGKPDAHTVTLPESSGSLGAQMTKKFDELDFDAEDETALRQAAMANAQNAVQEAQKKARDFNQQGERPDEDGEMNFQNPTGLGDIQVSQPKMLAAQLKEYQLKGLNWLAGLYENGINGILADEMGLGKTVQSISIMAHLAEAHNIWGPFLVIAPSSTLHNWQQEVARFVPDLKCLPYWGNAKDRKVLRKFWDRKHITYDKDSPFHVLITSYQLVVQDTQYFQKIRWQYMILDEAQAIKSSQSSRWKSLLGFHCRNRLLLTGTPIQNNMQELWALLHFIMPSLFDNHDEFSEWFSKDIENHAQSNSKLNEDQLMRLHQILKPFMLRRVKKHVQKELGDKIEEDVYCDLTYRQRAYYGNLRNKISIMDLIEKAAVGDEQDTATLMNLVMQFRKVCNHPDLFERADTTSPFSMVHYAETASFLREGNNVNVSYSTRNHVEYDLPRLLCSSEARLDMAGPSNTKAGFTSKYLGELMNIWTPDNIRRSMQGQKAFAWLRFADTSIGEAYHASHQGLAERAVKLAGRDSRLGRFKVLYDETANGGYMPAHAMFSIAESNKRQPLADVTTEGRLKALLNVSNRAFNDKGLGLIESCARPGATAPPIQISCSNQGAHAEDENSLFNIPLRKALYKLSEKDEAALLEAKVPPTAFPTCDLLPPPLSQKAKYTNIQVPSMRRFVTDSGKLAKLDQLLRQLKEGGHRVLLYFQMTRMIDLMEEYLTYRNYKYLRLDGSTKLEDRRDTVADFQTKSEIFVFLLSTRAGGLGINLTAADTVIFYDSDWNPTIDSQAMDRAHRLGQTRQVTVYRMITRGTIEERIRKRALQKEEVQRVVISGGSGAGVDFNTRSKENRAKDMALWLADDDQAEMIERKEKEKAERGEEDGVKKRGKKAPGKKRDVNIDDMYHEGEGHFEGESSKASGAATPIEPSDPVPGKRKGTSKKAKTAKQRLAIADGSGM